ncbi:MAG: DUF5666 domain-containing protein [Anaerolineae bacterium]|nr:DUF5666 domain-containing protein [Anaerolineae bacterium]
MVEQELLNIFNDCIDRIGSGQTIEDCLGVYPHYASVLRPMLEAGNLVKRARTPHLEITSAQERVRLRYETAIRTPSRRRVYPLGRFASLAAAVLIVFTLISTGAGVLAESSIPGDSLYGFKLFTENLRLTFSEDADLRQQFADRRVDEVRQLIVLGRPAEITFEGKVEAITSSTWIVASIPVQITSSTTRVNGILSGDQIQVQGYTTSGGTLIAKTIILIEPGTPEVLPPPHTATPELPPTATILPTNTRTVTESPTPANTPSATTIQTQTLTPSSTPSATRTASFTPTRTLMPSRTPSSTPSATLTISPSPTRTPTPSRTPSPGPSKTPAPTICAPTQPQGWQTYQIQIGDTLSSLAANRGITLEQLMIVNCLVDPGFIVVGQKLFLPPAPQIISTQPPGSIDAPPGDGGSDNQNDNNDDDNQNDNNDDDHGDDNDSGGDDND